MAPLVGSTDIVDLTIENPSGDELSHAFSTPPAKRRRVLAVKPPAPRLSDMMAAFGAQKSPESVSRMQRKSAGHDMRPKIQVNYAEPESESTTPDSSPRSASSFEDAVSSRTSLMPGSAEDSEDSEDELHTSDEIAVAPQRSGTRELPARSTRSNVRYATPIKKVTKKKTKKPKRKSVKLLQSDTTGKRVSEPDTARARLRQDILDRTKPKRDAFIFAHKELFLPVLPGSNYITKHLTNDETAKRSVVDLEPIPTPAGIKAIMKPYQLEGLSFLVYMHRNGMSPILGDEMGLGKTLQTLSLFQYIAENEANDGERQPHLVVCPLSVLSSWVAETRKWTDLNVVRFHGPVRERELLKQQILTERAKRLDSDLTPADIIVTTYETFKSEANWFKRAFAWNYCVLDEG